LFNLTEKYRIGLALEVVGFTIILIAAIVAVNVHLHIYFALIVAAAFLLIGRKLVAGKRDLLQIGRDEAHTIANRLAFAANKDEIFLRDEARKIAMAIKLKLLS
jgi:hypothetical protein